MPAIILLVVFGVERGVKAIAFIIPVTTFTTGLIIGLVKAKRGMEIMSFAENLKKPFGISHIAAVNLPTRQKPWWPPLKTRPVAKVSLAVYNHLAQTYGSINLEAAKKGLEIFAEHTDDARTNPRDPNIDRLIAIEQGRPGAAREACICRVAMNVSVCCSSSLSDGADGVEEIEFARLKFAVFCLKTHDFPFVFEAIGTQYGHAFQIPRRQTSVRSVIFLSGRAGELAKAQHGFDDAEYRFDGLLA